MRFLVLFLVISQAILFVGCSPYLRANKNTAWGGTNRTGLFYYSNQDGRSSTYNNGYYGKRESSYDKQASPSPALQKERDYDKFLSLSFAVEKGDADADAIFQLAMMYRNGYPIPMNSKLSDQLLQKAAKHGSKDAKKVIRDTEEGAKILAFFAKVQQHSNSSGQGSKCYDRCRNVELDCESRNRGTGFIHGMSGTSGGLLFYSNCDSERRSCLASCK